MIKLMLRLPELLDPGRPPNGRNMAAKKQHHETRHIVSPTFRRPILADFCEIETQNVNQCHHEFFRNRISNFSDKGSFTPKNSFRGFLGTLHQCAHCFAFRSGANLSIAFTLEGPRMFSVTFRTTYRFRYRAKFPNFGTCAKFRYISAAATASTR